MPALARDAGANIRYEPQPVSAVALRIHDSAAGRLAFRRTGGRPRRHKNRLVDVDCGPGADCPRGGRGEAAAVSQPLRLWPDGADGAGRHAGGRDHRAAGAALHRGFSGHRVDVRRRIVRARAAPIRPPVAGDPDVHRGVDAGVLRCFTMFPMNSWKSTCPPLNWR